MIDEDQIYIVVDIETDGPVPGLYSMLSIGAVATTNDKEVGSFYEKLNPLKEASQEPRTMAWWKSQPEAWTEVNTQPKDAKEVMEDFVLWLQHLDKKPLFVAQPVAFDYSFVSWYLWKFTGSNPFDDEDGSPKALDLSSFIAGKYTLSYKDSRRTKLPTWMKEGMPEHSHNALEDARGFAVILRNVLNKQSEDR